MKKKIAYLLLLLMLIPVGSFAKEKRTFEIKDGHFYVNGKVTPILSGEMHYPRNPIYPVPSRAGSRRHR